MDEAIQEFTRMRHKEYKEKVFFAEQDLGSEVHWFFTQAVQALESKRLNQVNAEVVRVRHNLCHGNILEYINTDFGEDNVFFTPECCRGLTHLLHKVSKEWARATWSVQAGIEYITPYQTVSTILLCTKF